MTSTTSTYELPKRRRIFLMRHGDVTYFDASGRAIDPESVPLNERGRDEASAAGREFKAQQIRFDKVIASGLPRTLETAQRVLAETGQQIDIDVWPQWQEIRGGRLSDLPPKDFERAFLSVFDGIVPETTAFLGGETIGELLDRVLPPLQRLRDDGSWDTVLLVLHGGVNRALLSHAITGGGRTFFGHLSQTTGCINALDVGDKPGDWVIRALNHSPPSPLHATVRNTTMELLYAQFVRFKSLMK
jgi:broad specificity phosphatase PhoE